MSEVTIRRATIEDADRLAFVAAVTFPLACPPHTTREDAAAFVIEHLSAEAFAGYLTDRDRVLLLAEESGVCAAQAHDGGCTLACGDERLEEGRDGLP